LLQKNKPSRGSSPTSLVALSRFSFWEFGPRRGSERLKAMRPDDLSYLRKRALDEQIAAQKAICEPARHRHDELAAMYRFRVLMLSGRREVALHPVGEKVAEIVD